MERAATRTAFIAFRLLTGVTFLAAPGSAQRQWLGSADGPGTGSVAARGMGARDVALSVGALGAQRSGGDERSWLLAAACAEAADALAVLAVARHVPTPQRFVAAAGPAALAAVALALARR